MRTTLAIVLAVIALAGPHQISTAIRANFPAQQPAAQAPTPAPDADLSAVAAKVSAMSPQAKRTWAGMFTACGTALRADSAAEPAVLQTLDSMRRFHLAVGRFAWHAVGGNKSDPELSAALQALFVAKFGEAERFLTAEDRDTLAATYDALAALAK
jgi:hypothetical protein